MISEKILEISSKMDYLVYKSHKIPTVLAITEEEQKRGLMFQEKLPEAMSFVYSKPKFNFFWMDQTPKPLDIIFCHQGKISEICSGTPYSKKLIGSQSLSDLVIEMPRGNAEKLGMRVGEKIDIKYANQSLSRILLAFSKEE